MFGPVEPDGRARHRAGAAVEHDHLSSLTVEPAIGQAQPSSTITCRA
jgi:hypothetical protein